MTGGDIAEIDSILHCASENGLAVLSDFDRDGVKKGRWPNVPAQRQETSLEARGGLMDAARNRFQAVRTMINGIHGSNYGHQDRGRANVRGGLLTSDVLFTRLQRQPVGLVAATVHGNADEPARESALVDVLRCDMGRMWTAETHRQTEALHRTDRDVSTELARRLEQCQCERIGRQYQDCAGSLQPRDRLAKIADVAERARVLNNCPENYPRINVLHRIADGNPPTQGFGSGLQNGESLRMAIPIGKKDSSPQLRNSFRHGHRFCRSRGFVEERGIGDVQRGEIRDHGLEIEQRLESTLTYFRLIWRVGGVPSRILQNVALNDGRQDRVIVSLPDHRR